MAVIIEDGYSDVPKGERHGCWGTDLPQIINYVNAKNAKRDYDEWKAAYDSAVEERNLHGAQTRNMDWDVYIDSLGPEPPQPDFDTDAVNASVQRQEQVVTINPTRRLAIVAALRSYMAAGLPLNKNYLPKRNLLNAHARFKIAVDCWLGKARMLDGGAEWLNILRGPWTPRYSIAIFNRYLRWWMLTGLVICTGNGFARWRDSGI